MELIDISKLKNVKNALTEAEILELNTFFNSFFVKAEIISLQKFAKKKKNINTCKNIYIFLAHAVMLSLLALFVIPFFQMSEDQKVGIMFFFFGFLFSHVLFKDMIFRWIDARFGLNTYWEIKKNFLVKISENLPENLRLRATEIDRDEFVKDLKARHIFQAGYYRAVLDDIFVFGDCDDEILLAEWRSYQMSRSPNRDQVLDGKILFKKNFKNSRVFSEEIIVKTKNFLLWKFGEKYERELVLFWVCVVLLCLSGLGIYFLNTLWASQENQNLWWLLIGISIFIFIVSILGFVFHKPTPRMVLSENEFSEKFSVYSTNPLAKNIFENPMIQKIFLDFLAKHNYKYDFYFWENNLVVIRNNYTPFLEFEYKSQSSEFIELLVYFYIEQKNILEFFEKIKIFYK